MPPKRNSMSATAIERLISQRVVDVLLDYEANQNGNGNENGNGNGNDNRNGSHDSGSGWTLQTARGCTYKEFLNLKYTTCTLLGDALTWWNSHVRTVGNDAAYKISSKSLVKMMTKAYYPRNEIQKLENELWNLTVKGTDLASYTQCFQKLALLCSRMLPEETDKVERFIWGLPDSIQGNVTSSKPTRPQETIKIANSIMDQKIHVFSTRQADNKIRMENNPKDDYVQQPPHKRQNVARAYTAGPGEKKEYAGITPRKFHVNILNHSDHYFEFYPFCLNMT
ncbi:reverse transcriptase domain-containing protein [Tanacetum coccineum]